MCINLSSIFNKLNKITTIYRYIVVIFNNDTTYSDTWEDPDGGSQRIFAYVFELAAVRNRFTKE